MEGGPEGWYAAFDLRTGSHQLAKEIAEATGTDRHVQILFDTVAPTTTTGNGDIWISTETITNTDGSANLNAIHIANSLSTGGIPAMPSDVVRYWHSEPSSALGRSHLEKLVSEIAKNWMPSEISAFNSPASDYEFKTAFSSEESVHRPISRKYRMHASILRQRDSNWADVSLLNSTSNVQIEIVSDPPGTRKEPQKTANSYFGNALRIKSGNTADASPPRIGGLESNTATLTVVLSANDSLETKISSWNDPRIVDIPRGKKWIVSAWFKSYGGYRYNMPAFRTYLKKKYNDDGTANGWSSHVGTQTAEPFAPSSHSVHDGVGWKRNSDYVDGEWVRRHMYLDLSTTDPVGGAQGTYDDNYTYWSNDFTTDYTGNTDFNHANSVVTNYNDAFANISVHPTPIYHFHLDYGINKVSNTGLSLWSGSADDYHIADRNNHGDKTDEFFSNAYMMNIQIRPHDGYSTSNPVYDTSFGVSSTDGVAGAGNTARVEVITDVPGANSYISGKALRIYAGNVINQGVANVTGGSGYIDVGFANDSYWREDAWRSPLVLKNFPSGKRWILSAFTKSWQSTTGTSESYKAPQFYVYARTQDTDYSNNWYGGMPSSNSLADFRYSTDWNVEGVISVAPEDGKWVRQYGVIDLTGSDYIGTTTGTGDEVYTYWSNTFDSSPEIFTGTDGYITHNNASVFRMTPANLYVASVPPVAERNKANSAMVLWDGDPDEYEFTGQGWGSYPDGGGTLTSNTYEMFTNVRLVGNDYWPLDYNTMSDQLNSKTAGAGNTARAEIITDVVGGNSYISGKALHIKNGMVIHGGVSTQTNWVEVHFANTHIVDGELPGDLETSSLSHPFSIRIDPERKWVVSWWEKYWSQRTRGHVILKKHEDDGSANTWISGIGEVDWSGYSDPPNEYFAGLSEGDSDNGNPPGTDIWHRRWQYFDLDSANTIFGFGGDWADRSWDAYDSLFQNESNAGNELGWITPGANIAWGFGFNAAATTPNHWAHFTKTTENYVPKHFSIFENANEDYDLQAGISTADPGSDFPIAVANGIRNGIQNEFGIDSVGVSIEFDTSANRANALGVLDPADSSGAGKALKITLPGCIENQYDDMYQFLFANVASQRNQPSDPPSAVSGEPGGASDFGAVVDHNSAYGLNSKHFYEYGYGIEIPANKRWVYSTYIKTTEENAPAFEHHLSWYSCNGTHIIPNRSPDPPAGLFSTGHADWTRISTVIDLTDTATGQPTANSIILGGQLERVQADDESQSRIAWYDGFQLEEVAAGVTEPTQFHPGTIQNAPRVANTILHSNTYAGPSGETSFSGKVIDVARAWILANTFTGDAHTWPILATGAWSNGYSIGRPVFSVAAGSEPGPIIKWATEEDPVLGGADGRQVARSTNRHYLDLHQMSDDIYPTTIAVPYWILKRIPTWRERNITQVAFQFYDDLAPGDQYDIRVLRLWQSESLPRNEIDTIQLMVKNFHDTGESYIDGIMVEDVTDSGGRTTPSPLPTAQTANIVHETTFLKDRTIGGIELGSGGSHLTTYNGGDGSGSVGYHGNSYPRIAMTIANTIVSDTAYWSGILRYTSATHDTWTVGDSVYDSHIQIPENQTFQMFQKTEPTWDDNGIATVIWDLRDREHSAPKRDIWEFQFQLWSNTSPFDSYQIIDVSIDDGGNDGNSDYPYRHLPKKNAVNMLQVDVRNRTSETYIDGIMLEEVDSDVTEPSAIPTSNAIHETTFLYDHDPEGTPLGLHVGQDHQEGFSGSSYPRVVANVYNTNVTSTSSHWLGRLQWTAPNFTDWRTDTRYMDIPEPTWQGPHNSSELVWDLRETGSWMNRTIREVRFQLWSNTEIGDSYNIDYINIDSGGQGTFGYHEAQKNEIDAMGFTALVFDNNQDVFIDGIQVEEVTSSNRRAPMINQPPQETGVIDFGRAIADGKTIYFSSNAFHGDTEDHKYGPSPQFTPEGLLNPTPYGDKWISLSPPYKTYLYFSNASNQTSQTAHHVPGTLTPAGRAFADTNWPYGTTNTASGWYEYRDTGDALTQLGLDVKLHKDSIDRVALGGGSYVDGGAIILDTEIPPPEDGDGTTPTITFGDPTAFGQTREILLNPVPPSDANLHGHWTLNSYNVDEAGNEFVYDVSGRNNHAIIRAVSTTAPITQDSFVDHDPASDVINVSGNRSLYLKSKYEYDSTTDTAQYLILANTTQRTYQGSSYPVNISDTNVWNKQTLTFWYKPGDIKQAGEFVGRDGRSDTGDIIPGEWNLRAMGNHSKTSNGDIQLLWYMERTFITLNHDPEDSLYYTDRDSVPSVYLDGWYGANDGGTYTPLRKNEWHFFAIQTDYANETPTQSLWIYREGEGLLYYNVRNFDASGNPSAATINMPLILNGTSHAEGGFGSRDNANGYYDEVRLYNSMLTPRNIRYLYMNPTGRPHQLQPRPGLAVKKNHITFANGYPSMTSVTDPGASAMAINAFAYFHGFDVDGNPADVDPYLSVDGQVKYLNRGYMKMRFNPNSNEYAGNTGYVMYNMENGGTAWTDDWNSAPMIQTAPDAYYVFAMPIGANTTQPHTWQYHEYDGTFIKFTPDESKHIVIGEARLANTSETSSIINHSIQSVEVYQMARQPSVVRQSYNFTITPDDFISSGGMQNSYLANAAFWNTQGDTDWTFISDLVVVDLIADNIKTGKIRVGVHVGADEKILIDGPGQRIVIKD
jgi:hypothetical protein